MASLMRVFASRIGPRTVHSLKRAVFPSASLLKSPIKCILQQSCSISTSKKNKDAVAAHHDTHPVPTKPEVLENLEEKEENWIAYGYNLVDHEMDEWGHHLIMFVSVSFCICWGTFLLAYFPDFKSIAWSQREAYLELARREKEGLPLIDCNLIDPLKIDLPSDDELGDFDIII